MRGTLAIRRLAPGTAVGQQRMCPLCVWCLPDHQQQAGTWAERTVVDAMSEVAVALLTGPAPTALYARSAPVTDVLGS